MSAPVSPAPRPGVALEIARAWSLLLHPFAVFVVLALVAGGQWWWRGGGASAISTGMLAVVALLCVAGIANRWIKLSLHMASLAFAGVALLPLLPPAGIAAIALLPLLGWARLRMARHMLPEVVGGALLGLAFGAVPLLLR